MDLLEAKIKTLEMLEKTGLTKLGWSFQWSKISIRKCGMVNYTWRFLELTTGFVYNNDWDIVRQTVIHEIAHILAWEATGDMGHSALWKAIYIDLGGDGERLNNRCKSWTKDDNYQASLDARLSTRVKTEDRKAEFMSTCL